jgi:glycerol-3-phosphate O-acyltransferase
VPGRALVEVNKRIGLRLLTKAGERSFVNFSKAVPVVGGVVGGTFDAVVCRMVGRTARSLFRRA